MITINKVTIELSGRKIFSEYSEQIPAGSITAIVGPNGSGKTTLLAAIAGDIILSSGKIKYDDLEPAQISAQQLATIRAMVIQNQFYPLGFTVRQIIEMAGDSSKVANELDIDQIIDRRVTTLSIGESQRVAIAQAVAQNTSVLLLDEPLAAQDIPSRKRIIQLLRNLAKAGVTVVVVAHEAEKELVWADQIIRIS